MKRKILTGLTALVFACGGCTTTEPVEAPIEYYVNTTTHYDVNEDNLSLGWPQLSYKSFKENLRDLRKNREDHSSHNYESLPDELKKVNEKKHKDFEKLYMSSIQSGIDLFLAHCSLFDLNATFDEAFEAAEDADSAMRASLFQGTAEPRKPTFTKQHTVDDLKYIANVGREMLQQLPELGLREYERGISEVVWKTDTRILKEQGK